MKMGKEWKEKIYGKKVEMRLPSRDGKSQTATVQQVNIHAFMQYVKSEEAKTNKTQQTKRNK